MSNDVKKGYMYFVDSDANIYKPCRIDAENVVVNAGEGVFKDATNLAIALNIIETSVPWKIKGYVDSPPLPDRYEVGDILIDKTPKGGGYLGWVLCEDLSVVIKKSWFPWGIISKQKTF